MSNDIAIRAEGLGKMFRLGELERYTTLRDTVQRTVIRGARRLFGKSGCNGSADRKAERGNTIWALRDVSFEVKHGEVLGIIGRNGAGKSTLLKILSRITEPTTGIAEIRGRVGSLLEVGTGFHPELTGRENVYLNGSILGMTQREIRAKFDDIVSFAGVEKFIDTPVKRYSSGMQVRLAFAVAAHLDPEVLIIDEVLAVGDAEFQKRCLGKMDEVARSGRTILFVSHNMAAVEGLCGRAILLEGGQLTLTGSTNEVVESYLQTDSAPKAIVDLSAHPNRPLRYKPLATELRLTNAAGDGPTLRIGDDLHVRIAFEQTPSNPVDTVSFSIVNSRGMRIATCNSRFQSHLKLPARDNLAVSCVVRDLCLAPGIYAIDILLVRSGTVLDEITHAGSFVVTASDTYGTAKLPSEAKGFLLPKTRWSIYSGP